VPTCVPFTPEFGCCADWDTYDAALQERAVELAWATLRTLSGGQVGNCPVTVRPCLSAPCGVCAGTWHQPRPVTDSLNEIHVGADEPDDPAVEMWVDTEDAVAATTALTGVQGEVFVGALPPADPGVEVWVDTGAATAMSVATTSTYQDNRMVSPSTLSPLVPEPWVTAGLRAGEWVNVACGTPQCSCTRLCEILLPGPVAALVEVSLDGALLPLSYFRVDNGYRIVRTDGDCWPSCQNLDAPLGAAGTLGITYVPGIVPDAAGLWAAGVLACEFVKACNPTSGAKCRLPASVTTIARQGLTMTLSTGMFEGNMTGIREVDAYLVAINPNGLRQPPMVWSPDVSWAKHRYETPQATLP
jgi:hypothetical protein